jgi:hypothetical protein
MSTLLQRFDEHYSPRVRTFAAHVPPEAHGIPAPHLPLWGQNYETAALKIGIVGRDTRGWSPMNRFVELAAHSPAVAIHLHQDEFDAFKFTEWTNRFGKTFFDTVLKITACLHGVSDWKRLKRRQEEAVLRSFFWANTNAIERYEVSPKAAKVPVEVWRKVKSASEEQFDSLASLLQLFRPDAVFVHNWDRNGRFFRDSALCWDDFGPHQAHAYSAETKTHVFLTAHPLWLNRARIYDSTLNGILERARRALSVPRES